MRTRRCLQGLIGVLAFALARPSRSDWPQGASGDEARADSPAQMVADLVAGKGRSEELRIDVEWMGRSVRIHGTGIGIWHGERQFRVSPKQIRAALKSFQTNGFGSDGGAGSAQVERGGPKGPPGVIGSVSLTVGLWNRTEVQSNREALKARLQALAADILNLCEGASRHGLEVSSLAEGLLQASRAKLAPETLELTLQRGGALEQGTPWILAINGRWVVSRQKNGPGGYGPPLRTVMSEGQFRQLMSVLVGNDAATLPGNLYSPTYTDLSLKILNHELNVQARRFSGTTPTTHGRKQEAFDRIEMELEHLHAWAEGQRTASSR